MTEIPSLKLDVKKDAWSQLQNGTYKITLTINPNDLDDNRISDITRFIRAPMGQRYSAVLVEIDDTEQPVDPEKKPMSHAAMAGMLCNEPAFRRFLAEHGGVSGVAMLDLDTASSEVRRICKVGSRADLNTNEDARTRWIELKGKYEAWRLAP